SFHWENVPKPLQVVHRQVKLLVDYLDWSSAPEWQQARLDQFLREDRERGFTLTTAPLLRLAVITLAEDSRYVVFSVHHVLLDGWSSDIIYKEAAILYEANCRGDGAVLPVTRPYGDYIAWLQQQDLSKAEVFWRRRLEGYKDTKSIGMGLSTGRHAHD